MHVGKSDCARRHSRPARLVYLAAHDPLAPLSGVRPGGGLDRGRLVVCAVCLGQYQRDDDARSFRAACRRPSSCFGLPRNRAAWSASAPRLIAVAGRKPSDGNRQPDRRAIAHAAAPGSRRLRAARCRPERRDRRGAGRHGRAAQRAQSGGRRTHPDFRATARARACGPQGARKYPRSDHAGDRRRQFRSDDEEPGCGQQRRVESVDRCAAPAPGNPIRRQSARRPADRSRRW